jgi:magnesium-protoporphyrin IX monomethyl ester (oxidative) cyclase
MVQQAKEGSKGKACARRGFFKLAYCGGHLTADLGTMDTILINPYYSQPVGYYSHFRPTLPVGLLYLAGFLRKHGLDCRIQEFGIFDVSEAIVSGEKVRFGISDDAIRRIIAEEHPKIVGITSMYSVYYRDVIEIANAIKRIDPHIHLIVGGNHPSACWEPMLRNQNVDVVVIGEGEQTFLDLCRRILHHESIENVPGIAFRDNQGKAVKTAPRPLIEDLDSVPFPDTTMVDYRKYLGEGNPYSIRPPAAGIVSSRGCPNNCVYCTIKAVWGRTWRGRSPKNVVDEIEGIYDRYQIREFAFLDDSACVDRQRWGGICDEIIRRRLDVKWSTPNGIAHWMLTRELLDKMLAAGCYRITFGIESGNMETRQFLGKPYSLKQARELIHHANRIGLWTNCTNILGFPYEDLRSVKDTIEFAKKCGTDFACFYLLMPQPTSEVYQYFKKEGLLDLDRFLTDPGFSESEFEKVNYVLNETGADTVHFNREELNRWQKKAYRSFMGYRALTFLLNPLRICRKIHSMEEFWYVFRLVRLGALAFLRTLNPMYKKSSDYLYEKGAVKK